MSALGLIVVDAELLRALVAAADALRESLEPIPHRVRMVRMCPRCIVPLVKGQAMASTFTGSPDFASDPRAVTLSPGGPGNLVDCMKCPDCGYSEGL